MKRDYLHVYYCILLITLGPNIIFINKDISNNNSKTSSQKGVVPNTLNEENKK